MPSGLAKVDAAKRDGSWSKLDAIESLEIPPDLTAALRAETDAMKNFAAFPRSAVRGILEWNSTAKKPESGGRDDADARHHQAVLAMPLFTVVTGLCAESKRAQRTYWASVLPLLHVWVMWFDTAQSSSWVRPHCANGK